MTSKRQQTHFSKVGECLYRSDSSKKYYGLFKIGGKQYRESLGTADFKTAKRLLPLKRKEVEQRDQTQKDLTLSALVDRYMTTIQHLAPKTLASRAAIADRIKADWKPSAAIKVSKVRSSDVLAWIGAQSKRPLNNGTLNEYIRVIRSVFLLGVQDRVITQSPADGVKERKRAAPIRETPTPEQFEKILAQIRSQPFFEARDKSADLIEFYGLSGLGNAESANLIVDDVDFAKNTVQVLRVKTGQGFLIPIYPQLLPLLTRLHAEAISRGDKKLFQVKEAETALENACRRLGFPHFTPRSLRRMFITRALELGIDVKVVAELQGHRDGGKLILQTYSHVNRPHLESMAQRLK